MKAQKGSNLDADALERRFPNRHLRDGLKPRTPMNREPVDADKHERQLHRAVFSAVESNLCPSELLSMRVFVHWRKLSRSADSFDRESDATADQRADPAMRDCPCAFGCGHCRARLIRG